jgi:hypothetical protein
MPDWPRADILALLGVLATLVVAALPPVRRFLRARLRAAHLRCGFPRRRYQRWFVKTYRTIYNVYLDREEKLDLGRTYVSVSVNTGRDDVASRAIATKVLGDTSISRLIVIGDPGSGKSTLLKAYGVGSIGHRHGLEGTDIRGIRHSKEVAFFVPLRHFAKGLDMDLHRYLIKEIMVRKVQFAPEAAEAFFRHLLERKQCVLLLDGLDEVPKDRLNSVRDAIYQFAEDWTPDLPTALARMVLTCRRQNFLAMREEWVPAFAEYTHVLSPFRDDEIFRYLQNLRDNFEQPQSPETFLNAVVAAGTIDLHRIPLILAMSVGLFLSRRTLEVPSSVPLLYRAMITELLGRHNFPRDPTTKANEFDVRDKYRFLREFALRMAQREDAFQDFSRATIVEAAAEIAPRLSEVGVSDAKAFVTEVIDRAGLLISISEEGTFIFAHRSIQEYLAAEELQRDYAEGMRFLRSKATDPEWRQVTLFFASGDQPQLDDFLRDLATHNLELAVHCLAGANASDEVASEILQTQVARLHAPAGVASGLGAMLSATISPRRTVRNLAIGHVQDVLLDRHLRLDIGQLGGEIDGAFPVLQALAGANAAKIASLVPALAANIPDDPRVVGILWRCLTAPSIEHEQASRQIVTRLLDLAIDPACFAELQRQLPFEREFITDVLRQRAYPFTRALPANANLVTLLAWAEKLHITPNRKNRFFEAKAAGPKVFANVEKSLRRTVNMRLFWPARVTSIAGSTVGLTTVVALLIIDPHVFLQPFDWWTVPFLLAPFSISLLSLWALYSWANDAKSPPRIIKALGSISAKPGETANALSSLILLLDDLPDYIRTPAVVAIQFLPPILYSFALAPIAATSVVAYVLLASLACYFGWWLTILEICARDKVVYLYRPNPFVDMYSDPASRHWLTPVS